MSPAIPVGVEIKGKMHERFSSILTPQALNFLGKLHREFRHCRKELLKRRAQIQAEMQAGKMPNFLEQTASIRQGVWEVAPIPTDLQKRWAEITGPTDRKMMINALNSGANVFMADLEDANSPGWENMIQGQLNLRDALNRTLSFTSPQGKRYNLNQNLATLVVRPRGWHLEEQHILIDGEPASGSLVDFGLYFWHNARRTLEKGTGPYFYLPKIENHLEARLWNAVFEMAQHELNIPRKTIKATVLIEHILAVYEMDEIIYELRDHLAGLNAGRWDYIFSAIKKFRSQPDCLFPDRSQVTMTVPFMKAYSDLLVKTCHKRGAHAIGGMAAFIPSRRDPQVNEAALAKVQQDKEREAGQGFDGSWVAHPDLVPVVHKVFQEQLNSENHQKHRMRDDVDVSAKALIDFQVPGGKITEAGFRNNISVGLQYMESWLQGAGAVGINNLMEDAATAEISRSQMWQWVHHPKAKLEDGRDITPELFRQLLEEEASQLREASEARQSDGPFTQAVRLLEELVMQSEFTEFLTVRAYPYLAD